MAAAVAVPSASHATSHTHDAHHAPAVTAAASSLSTGEVRKVDVDSRKITIRHGPLENLGMPPMTMVFQVSDPALLAQVKAGDKVRFAAEKSGGAYVVTRIEPQ
jgi:Cu/Ag efflux protein CusF